MATQTHRGGDASGGMQMTRSEYQAEKRQARQHEQQAQFEHEYQMEQDEAAQKATVGTKSSAGHLPDTSNARLSNVHAGFNIAGLMAWAAMFALVGNEVTAAEKGGPADYLVKAPVVGGAKIIVGGTIGTAALLMISHAGTAGQELATGLALVTAVSSMIIWGKPVFGLLQSAFGAKPTTPLKSTTVPTTATSGASK